MLHEYEHVRELLELLSRKGGEKVWKAHQAEMKSKQRLHILDNCVGDIKMNRAVIKRAPSLKETKNNLYEEDLFPEDDMTKMPKHLNSPKQSCGKNLSRTERQSRLRKCKRK